MTILRLRSFGTLGVVAVSDIDSGAAFKIDDGDNIRPSTLFIAGGVAVVMIGGNSQELCASTEFGSTDDNISLSTIIGSTEPM